MTEPTPDTIERRLRDLASYFTGTRMSHRLPDGDHGPARLLGVTYVNDAGEDCDVGEALLSIADDVAQLDGAACAEAVMTEPTPQATALRERLLALRRDIGTVITVASRRSDPDADHKAMLIRLREWEKELWEAALAQTEPRTDAPRAETPDAERSEQP